jgi:fatty-acyl-CoA synthase
VAGDSFSIEAQKGVFNFNENSKYLLASANFRIIAPALSVAAWSKGAAIVMPGPGFDPKTVMSAIQEHSITHVLLVPFQLHALVKDPSFSPEKTSSVINAKFGGDMVTKELLKKAQRSFPTAKIAAGHGMTEGGAVFSWPYFDVKVEDIPDFGGISTVGKVAPGSALRIYDNDNNRLAKLNEPGEFQMASPATIKNYLEDVDQDAFVQDGPDRWFKTGDVGFINEKGEVFLLGRLNDRIKRGGIRVEPAALQTSLSEFLRAQASPSPCRKLNEKTLIVSI